MIKFLKFGAITSSLCLIIIMFLSSAFVAQSLPQSASGKEEKEEAVTELKVTDAYQEVKDAIDTSEMGNKYNNIQTSLSKKEVES